MRIIKLVLLSFLRVIGGLLAIIQIMGLLPVLSWLNNLGGVSGYRLGEMLVIVAIKLIFLAIGIALYKGLKKPYDRLKDQPVDNKAPDHADIE